MEGPPPEQDQPQQPILVGQDNPEQIIAIEDRLVHVDPAIHQHDPQGIDSDESSRATTNTQATADYYGDEYNDQEQQWQPPPLQPHVGWAQANNQAPAPRLDPWNMDQGQREERRPPPRAVPIERPHPEQEEVDRATPIENDGAPLAPPLRRPLAQDHNPFLAAVPRQPHQRARPPPVLEVRTVSPLRNNGGAPPPAPPPDGIRVFPDNRANPALHQPGPGINPDRLPNRMQAPPRTTPREEIERIDQQMRDLILLRNRCDQQLQEEQETDYSTSATSLPSIRPPGRTGTSPKKKARRTRSPSSDDSSDSSSSRSRSRSQSRSRRTTKKKKKKSRKKSKKKSKKRSRRRSSKRRSRSRSRSTSGGSSRASTTSRRGSRIRSVRRQNRVYEGVPDATDLDSEDLSRMGAFYPMSHANAALRVALDDRLKDQRPEALRQLTSATGGDLLEQAWRRERKLISDQMTTKMMDLIDKYDEQNQSVKAAPILPHYIPASKPASSATEERVKKAWKIKTKITQPSTDLGAAIIDLTTNHNGRFTSEQVSSMLLEQLSGDIQNKVRAEFTLNPDIGQGLQSVYEEHCLVVTPHDLESEINSKRITYKNLESDMIDFKNKMQMLAVARQQKMTLAAKDAWLIDKIKPLLPAALSDYAIRITNKDQGFTQMGLPAKQMTWKTFLHKILDHASKLPQYLEKQRIRKAEAEPVPDEAPDKDPAAGGEATVAGVPTKNTSRNKGKKNNNNSTTKEAAPATDPAITDLARQTAQMSQHIKQVTEQIRDLRQDQQRQQQQGQSSNQTPQTTQPPPTWNGGPVPTYPAMYPSIQTTITPTTAPGIFQIKGQEKTNGNGNGSRAQEPRFGVYADSKTAKNASLEDKKLTAVDKTSQEHKDIVAYWNQNFPDIKATTQCGLEHARKLMKKPLGQGGILRGQPEQPSYHKWSTTEPGRLIPTDEPYKGPTFYSSKIGRQVLAAPLLEHLTTHCYRCNSSKCGGDVKSCPYHDSTPSWGWCPCGHGMHLHRECKTSSVTSGN